ncbi:MAG: hypothetical protein MK180_06245 [Rhodobacteraceae bacterium]|nr:hypothetical protein [Paracoccaceae bacterium]
MTKTALIIQELPCAAPIRRKPMPRGCGSFGSARAEHWWADVQPQLASWVGAGDVLSAIDASAAARHSEGANEYLFGGALAFGAVSRTENAPEPLQLSFGELGALDFDADWLAAQSTPALSLQDGTLVLDAGPFAQPRSLSDGQGPTASEPLRYSYNF